MKAEILPGRPIPVRSNALSSAELAAAEKLLREQDTRRAIMRKQLPLSYEEREAKLRRSILDKGDLDIKLALSTDEAVKINPIRFFLLRVLKRIKRLFAWIR